MWALQQLMERSYRLAGKSPELHLFPARVHRGKFDGNLNMGPTGIRKQFEAVRDAAGVPWFSLNHWRHTAITRMAEAGIPIATIMARAGHCSPKMTNHYTHISQQAERMAMQSMERGRLVSKCSPTLHLLDLTNPAIQAEIQRQVALALQRLANQA
jgi:integrase